MAVCLVTSVFIVVHHFKGSKTTKKQVFQPKLKSSTLQMFKKSQTEQHSAPTLPKHDLFVSLQGFEGTLVWENLDSAGLSTVNSSSVQLSDGGGVLKISSVRSNTA